VSAAIGYRNFSRLRIASHGKHEKISVPIQGTFYACVRYTIMPLTADAGLLMSRMN
jgi:bacillopeptidase F (M6 metalloprotease family)